MGYAKRIDNPAYKGVWKAKQIPNEKFVENVYSYDDIGSVGFELWTVNSGSIFDNISSRTASTRRGSTPMPTGARSARVRRTRRMRTTRRTLLPAPESEDDDAGADLDDEDGADDEDL